MANYENLKSAIQQVVKTNGKNAITGALLQQSLLAMINSLGAGYQFFGVATPTTNPGTPDKKVFYIASTAGTYSDFGGIVVTEDEVVVLIWDSSWHKAQIWTTNIIRPLLDGKQDTISDLDTIRQGAEKGSTALQSESDPIYMADKPNLALKSELNGKVDKEDGKVLSSNDYTDAEKAKLSELEDKLYGKEGVTISILDTILASLVDSYIDKKGTIISPGATWFRSEPYLLHKGEKVSVETGNISDYPRIFTTDKSNVSTGDKLNLIEDSLASEYTATDDVYVVVQGNKSKYWTKFDITKNRQKGVVDDIEDLKKAVSGEVKFKDKELYLIGDSLFAGEGLIGKKIAELLGCKFDNEKNTDASHPLSMGGTNSDMGYPKATYYRAKNLVDYGGITDGGKNAIILFENVNDATITFAPTRKSYICEKIVDIGSLSNLSAVATEDRKLTTAVKVTSTKNGKLLTITQLPTKEGNVTLRVGRGVEKHDYGIHLPANPTMQDVIDKILEYEYVLADNQYSTNSVSFASDSDGNAPSVVFTDTDGTGMQCTVTDVDDAKQDLFYYFDGDNIDDWTDTSKWVMPVKASGWKSAIEAVKRAFPFAKIAIVNMPRLHNITIANFLMPNGGYDENAFKTHCDIEVAPATTRNKAIASLYNVKYIEVANEWGISATNYSDYYYDNNVHPKNEGYYLAGEVIASQIKAWIG